MRELKRAATVALGEGYYYNELLGFAEDIPTKLPPNETLSATESSQFVELIDALRAANLQDNDVPLFTLFRTHGFGVAETHLMVSLMVQRKRGRGRPTKDSILKLQAAALREIKKNSV